MIFLCDSFCLSTVSLSEHGHDILDFSCCPLSHVLPVTLANLWKIGFEFHLRPSSSALLSAPCWRDPLNKIETAVHDINSWCSVSTFNHVAVPVPVCFLCSSSLFQALGQWGGLESSTGLGDEWGLVEKSPSLSLPDPALRPVPRCFLIVPTDGEPGTG